MALTETWLKSHKDAEVGVDGFKLFRADRKRRKKGLSRLVVVLSGGVAAYVNNDIASHMEQLLDYSNGVVEVLGLYSRHDNLFIAVVYRQPDDVVGGNRSTSSEFKAALDQLSKVLSDDSVIHSQTRSSVGILIFHMCYGMRQYQDLGLPLKKKLYLSCCLHLWMNISSNSKSYAQHTLLEILLIWCSQTMTIFFIAMTVSNPCHQ